MFVGWLRREVWLFGECRPRELSRSVDRWTGLKLAWGEEVEPSLARLELRAPCGWHDTPPSSPVLVTHDAAFRSMDGADLTQTSETSRGNDPLSPAKLDHPVQQPSSV